MAPTPAGRPCSFFFLHWIICHVLLYVSHSFNTCFTSISILNLLACLGSRASILAASIPARDPKQGSPLAGYKHLHSLVVHDRPYPRYIALVTQESVDGIKRNITFFRQNITKVFSHVVRISQLDQELFVIFISHFPYERTVYYYCFNSALFTCVQRCTIW